LVVGGLWVPARSEGGGGGGGANRLSFTTKAVVVSAALLTADKAGYITGYCPHEITYLVHF
jgi:hypothetical protein